MNIEIVNERNRLMRIAEAFEEFLEKESKEEHIGKDEVQEIIYQFLKN